MAAGRMAKGGVFGKEIVKTVIRLRKRAYLCRFGTWDPRPGRCSNTVNLSDI
jgi:hypothetical protein